MSRLIHPRSLFEVPVAPRRSSASEPQGPGGGIARRASVACQALLAAAALALAACSALPDKPHRSISYDFGPGPLAPAVTASAATAALPPITLADLDTSASRLEGTALNYRLGYEEAQALRPYATARWTQPPLQLFRQRLRDALAEQRTVLGTLEAGNLAREGRSSEVLRISLDEFSHYFASPTSSSGLVRVRATLLSLSPTGERVLGQRVFVVQRPAATADAAGGAKALASASDEVIADMVRWVNSRR
ncbi:ABC-type transport auxiliary lipoprotein family protein [Pseudacidovorax intermedius]|uniref:ABC-type transport auxiliary lipoprotein family protein n=1 Tax=Pseudacidovorax intermedius TaxID=433924 RepID=UPI00034C66BB|nr:ABC-type transport auxiliary lipoprotein family protein [Pseudacidovorax intermedius]